MKLIGAIIVAMIALAPRYAAAQDGKALYEANCKKCHGVLGVPPKAIKKKMEKIATFDAAFLAKVNEDSIVKVLVKGGASEDMKSFKEKLQPAEMSAVAKYVRELAAKSHAGASQ